MEQSSGDNSSNIQAGGNVTVGLSVEQARIIALDIFKANFYEFSEKAAKKALQRAEEITNEFISDFYSKYPNLESKLEEPAIQYSIYNVQKEYAKSGDDNLKNQLLELLLQRINVEERSLKQIVLDEAIVILPKLTKDQINILSLILSVAWLNHGDIVDLSSFKNFINNKLIKFYPEIQPSYSFFTHLQFVGCCSILSEGNKYKPLNEIITTTYKAFFSKGFTNQDLEKEFGNDIDKVKPSIISHLTNPELLQFDMLNDKVLDYNAAKLNLEMIKEKIKSFQNKYQLDDKAAEDYLISIDSKYKDLLEIWAKTDIKTIRLTSVGYIIAIMNFNTVTNSDINFENFI